MKLFLLLTMMLCCGYLAVDAELSKQLFKSMSDHFEEVFDSSNNSLTEKEDSTSINEPEKKEEVDSNKNSEDRNLIGFITTQPDLNKGHEDEFSQLRVIHKGNEETVQKLVRKRKMKNSLVNTQGGVSHISDQITDITSNSETTRPTPTGISSGNKRKFQKRTLMRRIDHRDLVQEDRDYQEFIVEDFSQNDFDEEFLDQRTGLIHQQLSESTHQALSQAQEDDTPDIDLSGALADLQRLEQPVQLHSQSVRIQPMRLPKIQIRVKKNRSFDHELNKIANEAVQSAEREPIPPIETIFIPKTDIGYDQNIVQQPPMFFGFATRPTMMGPEYFVPSFDQYVPPVNQFIPPVDQFVPPVDQFVPPINQFVPPVNQFYNPMGHMFFPPPQFAPSQNIIPPSTYSKPIHPSLYNVEEPKYDLDSISKGLQKITESTAALQNTERSQSQELNTLMSDVDPQTSSQQTVNNSETHNIHFNDKVNSNVLEVGTPAKITTIDLIAKEKEMGSRDLNESVHYPPTINPPMDLDYTYRPTRRSNKRARNLKLESLEDPKMDKLAFETKINKHIKAIDEVIKMRLMKKIVDNDFVDIDIKDVL